MPEKDYKKVEQKKLSSKIIEENQKEVVPFSVQDKEEERKQKVAELKLEHQPKPEEEKGEEIEPEAVEQIPNEEQKEEKGETSSPQE